jgi:AraC-like DNA-binding protein
VTNVTEQILAVQTMQDYIEAHLTDEITLADLAKACRFSPWYAHRMFREHTGYAPADYIRRLRLAKSALRLKSNHSKIIDVAYDLGFASVDGYTRAFRREFGMNPSEYARNPVPVTLFVSYGVKFRELRKEPSNMENVKNVFIQVVRKPQRKVIIKRGVKAAEYFDYCSEVGCDVWGTLLSMDSLCGEPVCMWLPEQYKTANTSTYVMGVEVSVDYDGSIPDGFDIITLPEADYLMFQGEPFAEEDYCDAISAVQTAMNRYAPSVIGYHWDDSNPRIQLEPKGDRGYIELRAVSK